MDIERLVTLVVKAVIEELQRQGIIEGTGHAPASQSTDASPAVPPALGQRARRVITARMVRDAARRGHTTLEAPPRAIITPLARDTAKEHGIEIRLKG